MRWFLGILATVMACALCVASEPAPKLIRETWDAAYLDGEKSGHFRTTVHQLVRNGAVVYRVTREMQLTVRRSGQLVRIEAQTGNDETPDGKLLGVFMTQALGTRQQLKLTGAVVDGVLVDTLDRTSVGGEKVERKIPLPEDLVTYLVEDRQVKQRRPEPGDRFSYRLFEPTVNNVVQVNVTVKNREKVPLNGANRTLLRVEAKPAKIQEVQLPSQTLWYDEDYDLVYSQGEIPGLGELTLHRTTKQQALAPLGKVRDLMDFSIPLDRLIQNPHDLGSITYRVIFSKDIDDWEKAIPSGDDRQVVRKAGDRTLELTVKAIRKPPQAPSNELISKEYLVSNYFINSDDALVKKHAAAAAGSIADPWAKTQAIERWVKANISQVTFSEAMATADHVARTMTGDCTEFSMLTAAMCRAQGIPSRTALGVVYVVDRGQAKMPYHMWTEVWIRGQWLAVDSLQGRGSVGPAHIKLADHSWYEVRSMLPMLPIMRVMSGKPRIEVIGVER